MKAVLFDLDGVLVKSEEAWFACVERAGELVGQVHRLLPGSLAGGEEPLPHDLFGLLEHDDALLVEAERRRRRVDAVAEPDAQPATGSPVAPDLAANARRLLRADRHRQN